MTLENPKDTNFNGEDDRSIRIYEISDHRQRKENRKDIVLSSNDSDMKIYSKK